MKCAYIILGICLTRPPLDAGIAIFGFAEFLAALALLVLVFNSTDYLYWFRIAVAPIPLVFITFVATIAIGVGTLLTDLWFAERWPALPWGVSRASLQGMFGALFLLTTLLWIWFAFIRPPVFGRWNCKRYHLGLYHAVVRGSDTQLPMIATEVMRSAPALIRFVAPRASRRARRTEIDGTPEVLKVMGYAHDTLLMLGNRKLCRHIVASSPVTAIVLMEQVSSTKCYSAPLGEFARNITTEALLNKDSILYLEDGLYASDLVGIIQPFSTAMYGDYQLVQHIGSGRYSPLDIDWRVAWSLDGDQFDAYCRITLITFKNYVESDRYREHSTAIFRALHIIESAGREVPRLDGMPPDGELSIASSRLMAAVGFVDDVIAFLGEKEGLDFGRLRVRENAPAYHQSRIFDQIAQLAYELVHYAAYVQAPPERAWSIQYNTVWGRLFGLRPESPAWRVIRFKLFRLLFDDIKEMERWPNYKGARLLGICLNVLGLTPGGKEGHDRQTYPLRKAVLDWTRKNYLSIERANPDIATYCLSGGVSFDAENKRLVKTYLRGTNLESPREYLQLDDPPSLT